MALQSGDEDATSRYSVLAHETPHKLSARLLLYNSNCKQFGGQTGLIADIASRAAAVGPEWIDTVCLDPSPIQWASQGTAFPPPSRELRFFRHAAFEWNCPNRTVFNQISHSVRIPHFARIAKKTSVWVFTGETFFFDQDFSYFVVERIRKTRCKVIP